MESTVSNDNQNKIYNYDSWNEDISLPKSCIIAYLKEFQVKNKFKIDKHIIDMLNNISKKYVSYLSSKGCQICSESGKKTLNIEHLLEALKQMNFKKYIDTLVKDIKEDETSKPESDKNSYVKSLINKRKKERGGKKEKFILDEEEKEQIRKQQDKLFKGIFDEHSGGDDEGKEVEQLPSNKVIEKNEKIENDLFGEGNNEEDIDFDGGM
jgi:histone H3/H4